MQISLVPFNTDDFSINLIVIAKISCNIDSPQKELKIRMQAQGDFTQVVVPHPVEQPRVKDNLWQETCFEVFLSTVNSSSYTEWNFSPSGNWAQYDFASYRKRVCHDPGENCNSQIPESKSSKLLTSKTKWSHSHNQLSLDCQIKNWHIVFGGHENLRIGISAVFKRINGDMSYWAIQHCGPKPDFHLFESFIPVMKG